jgi:hypothetical protein
LALDVASRASVLDLLKGFLPMGITPTKSFGIWGNFDLARRVSPPAAGWVALSCGPEDICRFFDALVLLLYRCLVS